MRSGFITETTGALISTAAPRPISQLTPGGRGFNAGEAGHHLKVEKLLEKMRYAYQHGANLLVNTALMPDGSLDLEDITTLLDFGKQLPA